MLTATPAPCPRCNDSGYVIAPEWTAWHDHWAEALGTALSRGHARPYDSADEVAGLPPDGPEEIECPGCGCPTWGITEAVA